MARRAGVPTLTWPEFCDLTGTDPDSLVASALDGGWVDSSERARAIESDKGSRATFRWVKALDIAQWHHFEGVTVTECGKRLGFSRQRAKQLLDLLVEAHPFTAPDHADADHQASEARSRVLAKVFSDAVDVLLREPGIIQGDLADRIGCSVTDLTAVLGDLSAFTINPAWAVRRGTTKWTDEDLASILRDAHEANGSGPLTKRVYQQLTEAERGEAPSHALISKRFGSWSNALEFAGLPSNATKQDYAWARARDKVLRDMVDFVLETGKTSVGEYGNWAADHPEVLKVPQAALGAGRNWTSAIGQVFDLFTRGKDRERYQSMLLGMAAERAASLTEAYGHPFVLRPHRITPRATDPLPGESADEVMERTGG